MSMSFQTKEIIMAETYQFAVETGDIVEIPGGTLGIVTRWDIVVGGNCKRVWVYPFTNWLHRAYLILTGCTWFFDSRINRLKPIHRASRR